MSSPPSVLFLGSATESVVPHWGGSPRRAVVVARPRLSRGDHGWLVRLDVPIPSAIGPDLHRVVLADRLEGYSIDQLRPSRSREIGAGWVPVHVGRLLDPAAGGIGTLAEGDLANEYWAEVALDPDNLPESTNVKEAWAATLRRIRRFIDEHDHSRVPEPYFDAEGRLDVIVGNLRWHHAGRAGIDPGPFPGVDYTGDLDRLPGWEW